MSHPKPSQHKYPTAEMGRDYGSARVVAGKDKVLLVLLAVSLIIASHPACALFAAPTSLFKGSQFLSSRATNGTSPLECLQVAAPILSPSGSCQQTLMVHTFGSSYGRPFIGFYDPPDCNYNRVTFNFTVTSSGRQFDRLGLMFFGDIEVFRTSTAEPTQNGIVWTYIKDMSSVLSLFKARQKVIFDLGNLIDDTYTGSWNTTLIATFFTAKESFPAADLVIPISARRSTTNESSAFIVPNTAAINSLIMPPNVKKAVLSISACGQGAEEFWWSNVLSSDTGVFKNETQLYGHSAFRELQILVDGNMAGVAWPFPIIFTGGIVPGFWRPIVGIDAFDLREDEIDITPFVPLLSDNMNHTFHIRVVGIDDDGHGRGTFTELIESYWIVTGKIFIWLDHNTTIAAGKITTISTPEPSIQLRSQTNGSYGSAPALGLAYSVDLTRQIYIESMIYTSAGAQIVAWKQDLRFSNSGTLSNNGNNQDVRQTTSGTHTSSSGFRRKFEYPLWVSSSYNAQTDGSFTIGGEMGRGKHVEQIEDLAFPNDWRPFDYSRLSSMPPDLSLTRGSVVSNWQNGTANYSSAPAQKVSYGTGSTEELFELSRLNGRAVTLVQGGTNEAGAERPTVEELYSRHIVAIHDSIVHDEQRFGGRTVGQPGYSFISQWISRAWLSEFAGTSIQALVGRGPV